MHKILVTGASGYIGPYLSRELIKRNSDSYVITVLYNKHEIKFEGAQSVKCDLTDNNELAKMFDKIRPDTVYHLASGTPTRTIGTDSSYIRKFNVDVTARLAQLCSAKGTLLIYTSTDLVYNGGIEISEDSGKLNPLTLYARTKLEGENAVRESGVKYIILRTALVYGFSQSTYTSFFDMAYETLNGRKMLRAFSDQYRNPLYMEDAASILAEMPALYKQNDIINFCGHEFLSRYDMCNMMSDVFGFDKKLIVPSSCEEFNAYPMVKKLGLKSEKLRSYGLRTHSFKENLLRSLNFRPGLK